MWWLAAVGGGGDVATWVRKEKLNVEHRNGNLMAGMLNYRIWEFRAGMWDLKKFFFSSHPYLPHVT